MLSYNTQCGQRTAEKVLPWESALTGKKKDKKNNEPSEEEDFSRAAKGLIRVHLFLRSPTCFTKAEFTFWDQVTLAVYFWLLSILFLKLCLIT